MPAYKVTFYEVVKVSMIVNASSEEEAIDYALDKSEDGKQSYYATIDQSLRTDCLYPSAILIKEKNV